MTRSGETSTGAGHRAAGTGRDREVVVHPASGRLAVAARNRRRSIGATLVARASGANRFDGDPVVGEDAHLARHFHRAAGDLLRVVLVGKIGRASRREGEYV